MMQNQSSFPFECLTLLFVVGAIYLTGRLEHRRISRDSEAKRIHGRYITEWVVIGFAIPGIYLLANGFRLFAGTPGALGLCMSGLLVGLAVGWGHGWVRLRQHRSDEIEEGRSASVAKKDDGNPYRSPNR